MWHFGTWFSRHGGVGLTFGLDDLRGLFQLMILWFYDSETKTVGHVGYFEVSQLDTNASAPESCLWPWIFHSA